MAINWFMRKQIPKKFRPQLKRKRKKAFRPKRKKRILLAVPRGTYSTSRLGGFPQQLVNRLKYVDYIQLQPTSVVNRISSECYRLNSLFDPYFSAGGHQPSGFDTLTQIYNHYCVYGCTVKMSYTNNNTSNVPPIVWGFIQTGDSTDLNTQFGATEEALLEQPASELKYANAGAGIVNDGTNGMTLTKYYNMPKWFGINYKSYLADPTLSSNVTTNPASSVFVHFFGTTGPMLQFPSVVVGFKIELIFDVVWSGPKPSIGS